MVKYCKYSIKPMLRSKIDPIKLVRTYNYKKNSVRKIKITKQHTSDKLTTYVHKGIVRLKLI